jgi:hypothetical protein
MALLRYSVLGTSFALNVLAKTSFVIFVIVVLTKALAILIASFSQQTFCKAYFQQMNVLVTGLLNTSRFRSRRERFLRGLL